MSKMSEGKLCSILRTERMITIYKIAISSLNIPVLQAAGILTICVIFFNIYYEFPIFVCLHAALTTTGIVIFMSEATILTVNKQFCGKINRHQNFIIHGILVTFGTIFILAGTFIIIWDRILENEGILNHIHTITGIISIFCIIISLVLGIIIVMLKHGIKPYILPVKDSILNWLELPHVIFGSLGYGIGMGSLCYGFALSTKFSLQVPFVVKSGCIIMCLIVAGWTMLCSFLALSSTLQRIVNSYEEPVGNVANMRRSSEQKVQTSSDMQDISDFD